MISKTNENEQHLWCLVRVPGIWREGIPDTLTVGFDCVGCTSDGGSLKAECATSTTDLRLSGQCRVMA